MSVPRRAYTGSDARGVRCVKMTKHFGKFHKTYTLIGGGAGLLTAVSLRATVGSPLPVLRLLDAGAILPPLWIMGLLWIAAYAVAGGAAGYILACGSGGSHGDSLRWRGMTFLVVEVTFSYAWYSLLFGSFLPFPAWICLALAVAAGGLCAISWMPVQKLSALASAGVTLWLLCLLLTHLAVILHN